MCYCQYCVISPFNVCYAKVGSQETLGVTGKFGLGIRNEAGQRLIDFKDALFGDARGASTITQQLVKNLFKTRTEFSNGLFCKIPGIKTFIVKVKEWNGAMELEKIYSKDEILEMYVNTVYFGNHSYGIKAAAKSYFNQIPEKLTYENILRPRQIGTELSHDVLNPARVPL